MVVKINKERTRVPVVGILLAPVSPIVSERDGLGTKVGNSDVVSPNLTGCWTRGVIERSVRGEVPPP